MEIAWIADGGGDEDCDIRFPARGGMTASGVVGAEFGECRYRLATDAHWRFVELELELGERRLVVERVEGGWTVDGRPRPDLADAVEIDLSVSPVTNTLPIRRLDLPVGASADITTAYISVPELTVQPDPQRYTRTGEREYRYESLDSDFTRLITVDGEGIVVDYPGLFSRRGRRDASRAAR
ncbi:putative glycolipid-binding domain-containing protein [Agromyces sp. LHK192]|uniref:putative glycolipid-binding domain-containing protein n=1 Tax=Agromyces sp. LHK192 TaxID=2498704 RepID=UPI00196B248B|nr:putative glycolipid-binding domain-containing protein [Agromyces sp. LHK192]